MTENKFNFEEKSIDLELGVENTPIRDYMNAIITIFDNIKIVKNFIEKKLEIINIKAHDYNGDKTEVECNKLLGDLVLEIKTFWNIFGSILLPIRNYSPMVGRMYSTLKDDVKIDLLDSIFDIRNKYIDSPSYEIVNALDHNITDEIGKLINGFSRLLISTEKLSALEHISARNINSVNWSFMTLLTTSVNNFINDDMIEYKVDREPTDIKEHVKTTALEFIGRLEVIYEYIIDTPSNKVLDGRLHEFLCAVINITLYNTYEDLKNKFTECYKKYRETIDVYKNREEQKMIEG